MMCGASLPTAAAAEMVAGIFRLRPRPPSHCLPCEGPLEASGNRRLHLSHAGDVKAAEVSPFTTSKEKILGPERIRERRRPGTR